MVGSGGCKLSEEVGRQREENGCRQRLPAVCIKVPVIPIFSLALSCTIFASLLEEAAGTAWQSSRLEGANKAA